VREAIRLYIEMRRQRRTPGESPRVKRAVAVQDALAGLVSGSGEDSTSDVRRWREAHR
jgi:hypothetical protein